MQVPIRQILEGLGGDQFIKRPVRHEFDLMEVVKEGLPIASIALLQGKLGLTDKETGSILSISEKTYKRRVQTNVMMTSGETEKAISLSELYTKGINVFRNQADFGTWLQTNIPGMGGRRPTDMIHSMFGRRLLLDELNRILHGVFS